MNNKQNCIPYYNYFRFGNNIISSKIEKSSESVISYIQTQNFWGMTGRKYKDLIKPIDGGNGDEDEDKIKIKLRIKIYLYLPMIMIKKYQILMIILIIDVCILQ